MKKEPAIAKRLLEVVPLFTSRIRSEIRSCVPGKLSIPHFRIMRSIIRGRTLVSEIAQHHGVSQPSMSRSVDALVRRGFIERSRQESDRRQAPLALTRKGKVLMNKIIKSTESRLSRRIRALSTQRQKMLLSALSSLEDFFSIEYEPDDRRK